MAGMGTGMLPMLSTKSAIDYTQERIKKKEAEARAAAAEKQRISEWQEGMANRNKPLPTEKALPESPCDKALPPLPPSKNTSHPSTPIRKLSKSFTTPTRSSTHSTQSTPTSAGRFKQMFGLNRKSRAESEPDVDFGAIFGSPVGEPRTLRAASEQTCEDLTALPQMPTEEVKEVKKLTKTKKE